MPDLIHDLAMASEKEAERRMRKIVRSANASSRIEGFELNKERMLQKLKQRAEEYKASNPV